MSSRAQSFISACRSIPSPPIQAAPRSFYTRAPETSSQSLHSMAHPRPGCNSIAGGGDHDDMVASAVRPQNQQDALIASLSREPANPKGWNELIHLAKSSGDAVRIKEAYDRLLNAYPHAVRGRQFPTSSQGRTGSVYLINVWLLGLGLHRLHQLSHRRARI